MELSNLSAIGIGFHKQQKSPTQKKFYRAKNGGDGSGDDRFSDEKFSDVDSPNKIIANKEISIRKLTQENLEMKTVNKFLSKQLHEAKYNELDDTLDGSKQSEQLMRQNEKLNTENANLKKKVAELNDVVTGLQKTADLKRLKAIKDIDKIMASFSKLSKKLEMTDVVAEVGYRVNCKFHVLD